MKRAFYLLLLFIICTAFTFGVDLGIASLFSFDLLEKGNWDSINIDSLSDISYLSMIIEVNMTRSFGLLIEPGVKFEEIPDGVARSVYNKNIHWNGAIGPVYHFFGYNSFFDPYLSGGFGCAGGVFFDERFDDWQTMTQLDIYIYAAAGIKLILDRAFFIGLDVRAFPFEFNPSPLVTYPLFPIGAQVSLGFRI